MGIRSLKDHCGLAFIAGSIAASEHFHAVLSEHTLAVIRVAVDDRLVVPANDAVVVQFPSVVEFATRYLHNGVSVKHGQRGLSRALDQAKAVEIQARLSPELRARAKSASTPFANAWMAPIPGADNPHWMAPGDWGVLLRRRFCLPMTVEETLCGNCFRTQSDVYGDHAVKCMRGPSRYMIHTAIRNSVVKVCAEALLAPVVEPSPFGNNLRPDVLLKFPAAGGRRKLAVIDVAMTSIQAHGQQALAAPGGAATRYEQEKRDTYQEHANAIQAELIPLIVDDAGAWGASSLPFFRRVAVRHAQRFDVSFSKALTTVMTFLSSSLMGAVANSIRRSIGTRPLYLP